MRETTRPELNDRPAALLRRLIDGAHEYPPRASLDRGLSTAAVQRVPYAWVAQIRPGGRVVTPWGRAYLNGAVPSSP